MGKILDKEGCRTLVTIRSQRRKQAATQPGRPLMFPFINNQIHYGIIGASPASVFTMFNIFIFTLRRNHDVFPKNFSPILPFHAGYPGY
jgi:hypothetical protein